MPPIKMEWTMNLNTMLTVAGFLLTFIFGYGAYKAFETTTTLQLSEVRTQRVTDVSRMESRAAALEASINQLNIQDARQSEQIGAMLVYLQRIERTLDALVKNGNGSKP
jgi:predicted histidine transporter YuiF (NhaC family)